MPLVTLERVSISQPSATTPLQLAKPVLHVAMPHVEAAQKLVVTLATAGQGLHPLQ